MKLLKYLLFLTAFIPLLCLRDFTPNNELRYLSIADEAIEKGHLFIFTDHGEPYADKPPLYLWLIMAGKMLFGEYSMFFLGLFSLIPALLILYTMDRWVVRDLPPASRLSSQLMLLSSGLFTGAAVVLRMDMLMCLFIVLSLHTFFRLYTRPGRFKDKFLLPVYIFLALFSKGPVGVLVPLLSITVFLFVQKEIRHFHRYINGWQWGFLLLLCCLWFTAVYLEGGKEYLGNLLFHQTLDRAVSAFHHKEPLHYYFVVLWYALAPWAIFHISVLFAAIRKKVLRTPLERFFLTIVLTTLAMLSVCSSKLAVYLLPVFPFLTYLSMLLLPKLNAGAFRFSIAIPAILLLLTLPAMYVLLSRSSNPSSFLSQGSIFILFTGSAFSLYFLSKNTILRSINSLALGILATLFIGSFTLPRLNQYIGLATLCEKARNIADERNIRHFYYYKFRSGEYLNIYLGNHNIPLRTDNLAELNQRHNFILFIRNKDIGKSEELQRFLLNKATHKVGNYSFMLAD